jgi:hypothetical protein
MRDLLIILPYTADGRSIDWASDWVMNAEDLGILPRRAQTGMAQGIAQALDALAKDTYRAILIAKPELWGPGITEVWNRIENARLFDGSRVCFATNWAAEWMRYGNRSLAW